jgi:hypothetical protein
MAEVFINSQSPIKHQVFWNGDVAETDSLPTVELYDITLDPAINPTVSPTQLLTTLTSSVDETNIGTYIINIPYQYTNRNRTLMLVWNYSVGGTLVKKRENVYVITSYVDFSNACGCIGISTDSSDPNYKSYRELQAAERYARKQIEDYTKQKFYLRDDVYVVNGYDSDILPLPEKLYEIHELYQGDQLLVDNINEIYNSNYEFIITETGYGIRVNRENMLDNTVYSANGMVPPSIHDYYNGAFRSGVPYRVQGRFGWDKVPDNVELAAIELMKDFFSKDNLWKNKYIKKISTFDWDFEYTGNAYSGTGNSYADKLLADYVLDVKVDII